MHSQWQWQQIDSQVHHGVGTRFCLHRNMFTQICFSALEKPFGWTGGQSYPKCVIFHRQWGEEPRQVNVTHFKEPPRQHRVKRRGKRFSPCVLLQPGLQKLLVKDQRWLAGDIGNESAQRWAKFIKEVTLGSKTCGFAHGTVPHRPACSSC